MPCNFNPLPRKEGDRKRLSNASPMPISIHSLVKRETLVDNLMTAIAEDFNPLPRKEGDYSFPSSELGKPHFNPLPRKEGDGVDNPPRTAESLISIHSLVKRETLQPVGWQGRQEHFNPLPRKEGDRYAARVPEVRVISIHSLVKRETSNIDKTNLKNQFQSTPS